MTKPKLSIASQGCLYDSLFRHLVYLGMFWWCEVRQLCLSAPIISYSNYYIKYTSTLERWKPKDDAAETDEQETIQIGYAPFVL